MANITVSDWMAAWEAATFAPKRPMGAATTMELATLWGVSVDTARARINRLWREGRIKSCGMERQQTPDGRGCTAPVYAIVGKGLKKKGDKPKRGK